MRSLFSILTLVTLMISPAGAQNYTLNAFLKHDGDIKGVAFSADGRTLASMGTDRVLHHWNPHTEKQQPRAEISAIDRWSIDASVVPEEPHTLPVNTFDTMRQAVSFPGVEDPDGLLASGSSDKTVWLQGFSNLRPLFQIQEQGKVWAVAFSPDGQTLASAGDFAGIHLWDLTTMSPVHGTIELKSTLAASTARVEGLAFSPDGQTLAVATGRSDGEAIHLWDLRTQQIKETLIAVGVPVRKVAFSPDGQMIAAGAGHTFGGRNVLLWKRGPLSLAKIPHSVELDGPEIVTALNKDFIFTVTVKNVHGSVLENVVVTLNNPGAPTDWEHNHPTGVWTNSDGKATFTLRFYDAGQHDIEVSVLNRATRVAALTTEFLDRVEVPMPDVVSVPMPSETPIVIQGTPFTVTANVTSSGGLPLENFWVQMRVSGDSSTLSSTNADGDATLIIQALNSTGQHNVEITVRARESGPVLLTKTFPNYVEVKPFKTTNEHGTTIYHHPDGNETVLIKGVDFHWEINAEENTVREADLSEYKSDYTKFVPPYIGKHLRLFTQKGNTCGIYSSLILASYYGIDPSGRKTTSVDEGDPGGEPPSVDHIALNFFEEVANIHTTAVGVTPDEVERGLKVFGVDGTISNVSSNRVNSLREPVLQSRPPIILERYSDKDYHYVVVIGYDTKKNMFLVADPNGFFQWRPWDKGTLDEGVEYTSLVVEERYRDQDDRRGAPTDPPLLRENPKIGRPRLSLSWDLEYDSTNPLAFIPETVVDVGVAWNSWISGRLYTDNLMFVPDKAPEHHDLESESFLVSVVGPISYDPLAYLPSNWRGWARRYSVGGKAESALFGYEPGLAEGENPKINNNKVTVSGKVAAGPNVSIKVKVLGISLTLKARGSLDGVLTVYYSPDAASAPSVFHTVSSTPLTESALLPNYPNPFNPETWIPYQLAKPAEVTLTIYSIDGKLIRTLALGHQDAGAYHSKARAAYWDGKNELGERVASGLYFYTFTTEDFSATRKMLIMK